MERLYERTKHQIRLPRLPGPERFKILLPCLARFGCAFVFTGASLRGSYLPLGLCILTVPGPGLYGLSALLGVCLSAVLLWGGNTAAELIAVAVLIRAAVWIFRGTEAVEHPLCLPAAAALMSALIGGALALIGGLAAADLTFYVLRILFCFAGAWLMRHVAANPSREALLFLAGCLVLSACAIAPMGFSLGVLLAALFSVYTAGSTSGLAVAAVCGIAVDCTLMLELPMTAMLCLMSLLSGLALRRSRSLAAALSAAILLCGVLLSGWDSAAVLWAGLPGILLACVLPGGLYQPPPKAEQRPKPPVLHMEQASVLLENLSEQLLLRLPEMSPADPSMIFDRAADRICKSCVQFNGCWSGACEAYEALSGAAAPMLERGAVLRDDFPVSFLSRCRHIEGLLSAINQELDSVLYRRQFRHRLEESRSLLAEQYRIFAAYLDGSVQALSDDTRIRPICSPVLGVATAERKGSTISGDRGASFRTARHLHYVLLCDGMGSGPDAMEESMSSVRLLRGLLTAGFQPEDALQLLNSVYLLRDDGAFSTVDLLRADLSTGALTLWKWGSAPSYLKQGETLQKIGTALPPPGLEGTGRAERFELSLGAGDLLILLSDGAEGPETEEQIRAYGGRSPKELAAGIVGQGGEEEDDRTAVVLKLQPIASRRQHTTNCA